MFINGLVGKARPVQAKPHEAASRPEPNIVIYVQRVNSSLQILNDDGSEVPLPGSSVAIEDKGVQKVVFPLSHDVVVSTVNDLTVGDRIADLGVLDVELVVRIGSQVEASYFDVSVPPNRLQETFPE